MSAWLSAAPALIAAVAISIVPGIPAAWALRLRGLTFAAAAVAASFASIGLASIAAPLLRLAFGPLPVLTVGLLLGLALLPLRRFCAPRIDDDPKPGLAVITVASLLLAALLIGLRVGGAIGDPAHISQSFDAVFHLNAATHVLLTGNASPLTMTLASPAAPVAFYPTVWHASVALVAGLSGTSVPVATNAFAIVVAAGVWPVAMLFFARPFFGARLAHTVLAAILTASFSAFPYLLLAWGVLYPNLLSTALLPIALGFLHLALRPARAADPSTGVARWVAAAGAFGAATLAHPNAVSSLAALGLPLLVAAAYDALRNRELSPQRRGLRVAGVAAAILGLLGTWLVLKTGETREYDYITFVGAIDRALTNAPLVDARAWVITVLTLTGVLVLLWRRHHRWLIFSYGIAAGLFILSAGLTGPLRDFITGPWYSDAARLAALTAITAIPLAAVAASWGYDLIVGGLRKITSLTLVPLLGATALIALLLIGTNDNGIARQLHWLAELHELPEVEQGSLLSVDEIALLDRLDDEVPEGSLIAGDPWSGTGLALTFSERNVLFPHLQGVYAPEAMQLAAQFSRLPKTEACTLLDDLGIDYMLDFDGPLYSGGTVELRRPFTGLRAIGDSPALELVDRQGEASLYRVDCA